ncbi:hypothetical protein ENUP19_0263G0028 [Entamoeba nuttalli]|uniref:Rab GTPase activating protein, putative n=2 Tax=Entamoeba nuttalli TaxID=412467 RepID=K2GVX5_ENTNP|nr:Rab GTPase activating protein, putative [Entamoeba nuttalli P19]EKE39288.1 Rab GTPase activating protein, putative [Entamoeba nuttalli P19]|eukprot:XP_008858378.1 Rab GTPase activating protein, putative [Entamoeba nuttalli P19]
MTEKLLTTPRTRNTIQIPPQTETNNKTYRSSKSVIQNYIICSPRQTDKIIHMDNITYLSKPPQQGVLLISTIEGHTFIKFQPYLNQNVLSGISPSQTPKLEEENEEDKENEIYFCIEDTPTYKISHETNEIQITFIPGRTIPVDIKPIEFKKGTFPKFCEFLKQLGIHFCNGNISIDKRRLPRMIDIPKYLNELSNQEQKDKRINWCKQIQFDCIQKINKNYQWNNENESIIRKGLFYKGVDNDCRCSLWSKCLGNSIDKNIFEKIKLQVNNLVDIQIQHCKILREEIEQILKDVKRTTVNKSVLEYWNCPIEKIKTCIELLMKCWIIYDLDKGYQQGMSDILVGIMECSIDDYELFSIFVQLIELMSSIFNSKIPFDCIIGPIVKTLDLELEEYFNMKKIGYSFMYKWLILLFRRDFVSEKCIRLWDAIIAYPKNKFHYFIAVSMLLEHRDIILSNRLDLDDISIFFLQLENKFDDHLLIDADIALSTFKQKASKEDQDLVFA